MENKRKSFFSLQPGTNRPTDQYWSAACGFGTTARNNKKPRFYLKKKKSKSRETKVLLLQSELISNPLK